MPRAYSIFIDNIEALFGLLEGLVQTGEAWIFRGQANASWKLSSSLERIVARYARQQNRRIDPLIVEGDIVEMGQRILKARPGTANCIDDEMELLAYIQHYGGVTRLLDFTDSFAVALFFAVDEAVSEFATVWCLNRRAVNGFSGNRVERRKAAVCALVTKQEQEGVISFAPRLLNERMIAQQGLFLMPLSGRRELQQSLFDGLDLGLQDKQALEFPCEKDLQQKLFCMHCAMNEDACDLSCSQRFLRNSQEAVAFANQVLQPGEHCREEGAGEVRIMRINIPNYLFMKTQEALRKINVTANTLFPSGEDGICRSLNFLASGYRHHSAFENI